MSSNNSKDVILYPNKFNISSWDTSLELWNKGNTATTVNNNMAHKTIYSPSPNKYTEPMTAAFTGFTTTGNNSTTISQFNILGMFNKGLYFYCNPNFSGLTLYFPALGYLKETNNTFVGVNYNAGFWAAGPSSLTYARHLYFYPGDLEVQSVSMRVTGYNIYCVYE